jgi:hypothetical protein
MTQSRISSVVVVPAWARTLAGVLDRLHERFSVMRALCDRQRALVGSDDPEGLVALMSERQPVIDEIQRIDRELEPLRPQWVAGAPALPVDFRERLARRIEEIGELSAAVAQCDEADRAAMAQRRDEVAERLVEIGRGRGALAAYGRTQTGPSFQDTEA